MNTVRALQGLKIDRPMITPQSANFCPPVWPVPDDFPVVIDADGEVVSRLRDLIWNLLPWAGVTRSMNFGPRSRKKNGKGISLENARIFQDVAAWWLWGENPATTASGLLGKFDTLKPLFVVCSESNISAIDLHRYPRVVEKVGTALSERAVQELVQLWLARDNLGFVIADEAALVIIARLAKRRQSRQTPYIPIRIWQYQNLRVRKCLDDYNANKAAIEACYNFCLDAYAKNGGEDFTGRRVGAHDLPFLSNNAKKKSRTGKEYFGSFLEVLQKFAIADLLARWVEVTSEKGIKCLATYLSLVSEVGMIYIMDCSFMRSYEAELLRADCHSIERDALGEDVHLLGGITTKTITDPNAKWIASPSVEVAIDALVSVAKLHVSGAKFYKDRDIDEALIKNPYLLSAPIAPWSSSPLKKSTARKMVCGYSEVIKRWPKLLDQQELVVSKDDLAEARRVTPILDSKKFRVGTPWRLADHQLRRTGAVNMLASDLVMESSIQYQLKHSSRLMTRYYCQNHYKLNSPLVDEAKAFFFEQAVHSVVKEFQGVVSDRFISPFGAKRKEQILYVISEKNATALTKDARNGKLKFRSNFFGGCAKQGDPCPYGGVGNVSFCMGFGEKHPCADVLLDTEKSERLKKLLTVFETKQLDAPVGSDLHAALSHNIESTRRALDAIANGATRAE